MNHEESAGIRCRRQRVSSDSRCSVDMRLSWSLVLLWLAPTLLATALVGCSASNTPPPVEAPTTPTLKYRLTVQNLRPIDTSYEQYVLWLRVKPSEGWVSISLSTGQRANTGGALTFSSTLQAADSTDSIDSAILSIEPLTIPQTPTSILITGAVARDTGLLSSTGAGDFSLAAGSALFTTRSSDTNRAKNEFYLMHMAATGTPTASITGLPRAPAGWIYGLWVLDSNFFPPHQFLYGYFSNSNGPDSNATNASYPFPGGYNPAPLTDGGARIVVTLEPITHFSAPRPKRSWVISVPSPIEIMSAQLRRFISFGDTIQFQNVWSASAPTGTLILSK